MRAENEAAKWLRGVFRRMRRALKRMDRTPRMRGCGGDERRGGGEP
ncbi:MAG: hypothetical protein ACXQTZ_00650 [Candidatus Alkanophagales archaeon]